MLGGETSLTVGVVLSFLVPNINTIWDFMTASLGVGMFVPTILRWYWGRFNGYGYATGVLSGMVTAMILKVVADGTAPYQTIPIVAGVSLLGCVVGTLTTPPVPEEVRENFVRQTRAGGWWADIRSKLDREFLAKMAREHRNDIAAALMALPAQLCFFFACLCLIARDWIHFGMSAWYTAELAPAPSICRSRWRSISAGLYQRANSLSDDVPLRR